MEISFIKSIKPIQVLKDSNLLEALLKAGIPVASSCYGDGVCAKCRVEIIKGHHQLSPENEREKFLKEKNNLDRNIRIACQTQIHGPITVDTAYW